MAVLNGQRWPHVSNKAAYDHYRWSDGEKMSRIPKLVVIADDLTGASDTGAQFCKCGLRTSVLFDAENASFPQSADVIVVNTDSRALSRVEAGRKVGEACRLFATMGVASLYKKIDSTLRGNIGAEIMAAWEEFRPVVTVIAPAYPQTGRTTVGGYQLLDGVRVSSAEMSCDLQAPVSEARIPALLAGVSADRTGSIPLRVVQEGAASIRRAMSELLTAGSDWLVCDAATDDNLRRIAEAAAPFGRILWVGSAGLAAHIGGVSGWAGQSGRTYAPFSCGSVLVVAGSVSAVTQNQIEYYVRQAPARRILLDPLAAIRTSRMESGRIVAEAGPRIKRESIALSCPNDRQMIEDAVAAGKSIGLDVGEISGKIAEVLGEAVAALTRLGADGLFLTGGETAVACCRALQATGISLTREVVSGIPAGRLIGGPYAGLPVVTKAGAFGGPGAIVEAVGVLKAKNETAEAIQ
jgi:uncharacterized protein YgbK (DUF1537 family)